MLSSIEQIQVEIIPPSLAMFHRWPSIEAQEWTATFVSEACRNPQILAVVAFGSAIRRADYSADIDLLLVQKDEAFSPPVSPIDVDIRVFHASTLDEKIANGHDLLGWVLRFGEIICEKQRFWEGLRESWADRLPLPSAIVAEERADRLRCLYEKMLEIGDLDAANEQHLAELTQTGRSSLIQAGIYPASRPEIPEQLRQIGEHNLAASLDVLLKQRSIV